MRRTECALSEIMWFDVPSVRSSVSGGGLGRVVTSDDLEGWSGFPCLSSRDNGTTLESE